MHRASVPGTQLSQHLPILLAVSGACLLTSMAGCLAGAIDRKGHAMRLLPELLESLCVVGNLLLPPG